MTDVIDEAPVLERAHPAPDADLVASFRAELEARRLKRAGASVPAHVAAVDGLIEDAIEGGIEDGDGIVELELIEQPNYEAPVGTGYDFDEPKAIVGDYIPTKDQSYAYQKVLQIRLMALDTPTIEPTDFTLDEFDRIEKYNLELVERKYDGKKS